MVKMSVSYPTPTPIFNLGSGLGFDLRLGLGLELRIGLGLEWYLGLGYGYVYQCSRDSLAEIFASSITAAHTEISLYYRKDNVFI